VSHPSASGRAPYLLIATAVLVALAAAVALVVVLVTGADADGSDPGRTGRAERGFASPEEAVEFLVDRLAAGDAGATEAFAVAPVVEGYDFERLVERQHSATSYRLLPDGPEGYDDLNVELRRGEVAEQVRSFVRSILAPERDQLRTTSLDDGTTAADLAEELSPEPLAELSLARVDELENDDEEFLASVAREAETYGADEIRMIAMLLDTAEGQVIGGAVAVRYGEEWGLMSLTTPLLDVLPAQVEPVTEEGYLEALESAGTRY
jgi:hypothetical protein